MAERQPEDLTILVVEDYEDASLAMRLALEKRGYRILEADDGERAVEVAARARPDIILMDLQLPVLDGLAATERIRAIPDLRQTIIVAVSGHNEDDHRERARAAGCNAFFSKPIDIERLNVLLADLLP
ncbi:MAG TPA: response regulator [Pyrinomonadaceae bacterium]|nr:response regulator [Pyrinomonadaceae bacterium]